MDAPPEEDTERIAKLREQRRADRERRRRAHQQAQQAAAASDERQAPAQADESQEAPAQAVPRDEEPAQAVQRDEEPDAARAGHPAPIHAGVLPAALLVAVELRLGWVAAGPAFASPAPDEPFLVTIAIEAALMAAVATTEELLFRGWIQINLQRAFQIHLGLRPARACAATAVASGLVFTFAHDLSLIHI